MNRLIQTVKNTLLNTDIDCNRYILISNAFEKRSLYVYKENECMPSFIVKIPGTEEGEKKCGNEFKGITYITEKKIKGIISAAPLGIFEFDSRRCYIQSALFSKPMLACLSPFRSKLKSTYFKSVAKHLVQIYLNTKHYEIEGKSYCNCLMHGDFWIGNLGLLDNDLVLYDLEFFNESGLPLYDLIHFGLYYYMAQKNSRKIGRIVSNDQYSKADEKRDYKPQEEDIYNLLLKDNGLSTIMRRCILYYIEHSGISYSDACDLIKSYVEEDRGIEGLDPHWEGKILNQ